MVRRWYCTTVSGTVANQIMVYSAFSGKSSFETFEQTVTRNSGGSSIYPYLETRLLFFAIFVSSLELSSADGKVLSSDVMFARLTESRKMLLKDGLPRRMENVSSSVADELKRTSEGFVMFVIKANKRLNTNFYTRTDFGAWKHNL